MPALCCECRGERRHAADKEKAQKAAAAAVGETLGVFHFTGSFSTAKASSAVDDRSIAESRIAGAALNSLKVINYHFPVG